MPGIHVRPYSNAFGGAAPTLEALLSMPDAFLIANDFLYPTQAAASSGIAVIPTGIGAPLTFDSEPDSAAPTIVAAKGGVISFASSTHAADDGTTIATAGVFNPYTDDIWLAFRVKVDVLTNQFFMGLQVGTPAPFFSGAGAITPANYLGILTCTNNTPTLSTDGTLRLIANQTAITANTTAVHTMVAATWFNVGIKITAGKIRCWINGVDKGTVSYVPVDELYNACVGCADYAGTDIVPSIDWFFAASTRR